jgi:hypothetical protein
MVVTTTLFAHTTSRWALCSLICFIPIVKPFLTHWSWLRFVRNMEIRLTAGDAYSSMAPDPTFDIHALKGTCTCTPILWLVFPIGLVWWGLMRLITVRYLCHFIEESFNKSIFVANMIYLEKTPHFIHMKMLRAYIRKPHSTPQVVSPGVTHSKLRFYCLFGWKTGSSVVYGYVVPCRGFIF